MSRIVRRIGSLVLAGMGCGLIAAGAAAQTARHPNAPKTTDAATLEHGLDLSTKGQCTQALSILRAIQPRLKDKQDVYSAAMATARCAMSLHETDTAVRALLVLNRDFPREPEVLYITTHYYSELAGDAAQLLAATSPLSYQAHELNAEAYESHEQWDQAQAEYEKILQQNPTLPGIHYRLGRVLLSKSLTPSPEDIAKGKEQMEEELKINPANASAEFMLGEIARRGAQLNEAIEHFSRATHLDEGFSEAYLALGISLNGAGKYAEAIPPLLKYEKMLPADPSAHYQLALAYARTGRKQDSDREMALQREASEKLSKAPEAARKLAAPR
ncbi:MAG TPA: tetratricopeptide repeat protein [Candidatus Acidoferrales bacterium]|nr:tetratricopeptide repeat protein [Candidatus Acidoferrales bacterium]